MIPLRHKILFICFSLVAPPLLGYGLPPVNLGFSNILDGGPIRPLPGWYWEQYFQYYHANTFLNGQGKLLDGVPSPHFDSWVTITQIIYQAENSFLFGGKPGIDIILPIVLSSKVSSNKLGFSNSGAGDGDLILGVFLQWDPIMYNDRPLFVHRLEFEVSFPTGKNDLPQKTINPGNDFLYVNPYWAWTFYFTEHLATSWRFHYLWNATNNVTGIQAGDAVHFNYSMEYEALPNFWLAMNGYYLQQLHDDKLCGVATPNSKERVFAVGPGALYLIPDHHYFFGYLYFESDVRNRPQGISAIFRYVLYF